MIAFVRPAWCSGLTTRWTGAKSTGLAPKTPGTITMKTATASIPVLLAVSRAASSCVELQGIVPGGGEGLLDLVVLLSPEESLGNPLGPLHVFSNPVVVAGVSDAHRSFLFPGHCVWIGSSCFTYIQRFLFSTHRVQTLRAKVRPRPAPVRKPHTVSASWAPLPSCQNLSRLKYRVSALSFVKGLAFTSCVDTVFDALQC